MQTVKPRHSDLNVRFGLPGAPGILYGKEAVQAAIRLFFASPVGSRSRTFNPLWGCDLIRLLQEPMSEVTAGAIKATAIASLARFEPRITIMAPLTKIVPNYAAGRYDVTLVYKMSGIDHINSYNLKLEAS